jgi:hypothetical protein
VDSAGQNRTLLGVPDVVCACAAWAAWAVLAVVMGAIVARSVAKDPTYQVSNDVYEQASAAWWERESLYRPFNDRGFLYLPHAAVLYTPFARGDAVVRHVAVRSAFAILLVAGLACLSGVGDRRRRGARFLLLTLACLPLAVQNLRQGQMNLPMVGAMLLSTAALATGRWGWAAAALTLAVLFKPIAAPLLLLAGAVFFRPLAARLLVGLVIAFALPFLAGPPAYVWEQYGDLARKLAFANAPPTLYYDLRGLLEDGLGVVLPTWVLTLLRLAAALGVLALGLWVRRRRGPQRAALALYVLAACYLMLFNPKTEDPTYLVLGAAVGLSVVEAWTLGRAFVEGLLVLALPLTIALSWELFGGRAYWFRPALAALFLVYVLVRLRGVRGADALEAEGGSPSPG